MEKDFDGWELLSDDGFLEDGGRKNFVGKQNSESVSVYGVDVDADYFKCHSPSSRKIADSPRVPNQLVPVPIRLEPRIEKPRDDNLVKEITLVPSAIDQKIKSPRIGSTETDQGTVSQVFFKKKENEFDDMTMFSPKSGDRGMFPQIDTGGTSRFEDHGERMEIISSPRMKDVLMECDKAEKESSTWEENSQGFNLFKWSFTGIGAICSFGVAAATICILFFGSQKRNTPHHNPKIRFQIYTDDKRIKQMVQQATRMNDAISATRAQITFGGYYDGL
ncbi:hypothetical protein L6164_004821 [Bauhinia variegata]|uniref:Uncharacterized protein n=1 Tax=Bauhinia variegata TaxID=167791 RepID=A0ACB9PRB1_BAUVA|nr:hypothetical protein L6164_004821 [Bauhinia variegata]